MLYFSYHRTSTTDQHLDRGLTEIKEHIKKENITLINDIYTDQCTGKNFDRPSYRQLIADMDLVKQANPNEKISLIVTELDRLGRNKQLTLKEIRLMQDKGIRLMVLEIPTTLAELPNDNNISTMIMETINNMLIEMYASFAQAELEKKEKRQIEGIQAKKARGEWGDYGRPRALDFNEFSKYYKLVLSKDLRPKDVMDKLNLTKPTYYRYIKEYEEINYDLKTRFRNAVEKAEQSFNMKKYDKNIYDKLSNLTHEIGIARGKQVEKVTCQLEYPNRTNGTLVLDGEVEVLIDKAMELMKDYIDNK